MLGKGTVGKLAAGHEGIRERGKIGTRRQQQIERERKRFGNTIRREMLEGNDKRESRMENCKRIKQEVKVYKAEDVGKVQTTEMSETIALSR